MLVGIAEWSIVWYKPLSCYGAVHKYYPCGEILAITVVWWCSQLSFYQTLSLTLIPLTDTITSVKSIPAKENPQSAILVYQRKMCWLFMVRNASFGHRVVYVSWATKLLARWKDVRYSVLTYLLHYSTLHAFVLSVAIEVLTESAHESGCVFTCCLLCVWGYSLYTLYQESIISIFTW